MDIFNNKISRDKNGKAITSISGAEDTAVGPPAEYGGSKDTLNPEEMFTAAVNSCLMLVFQHFVKQKGVELISYKSSADGKVEKTKNGLRFTEVKVTAEVEVDEGSKDKIPEIAELAEKYCLVSNSVSCPIEYQVKVVN